MTTTRPSHKEVSNHFWHDARDLLIRFKYCFDSEGPLFQTPRSRRMKCFIDLRMAMESILKSIVTYYAHDDLCGEKLVKEIENYRHHLHKLLPKALPHIPSDEQKTCEKFCEQLGLLPVGLRYRLDTVDFRDMHREFYYETIGGNLWMYKLYEHLNAVTEYIGKELGKGRTILTPAELKEEVMAPRHNKYFKPKKKKC